MKWQEFNIKKPKKDGHLIVTDGKNIILCLLDEGIFFFPGGNAYEWEGDDVIKKSLTHWVCIENLSLPK